MERSIAVAGSHYSVFLEKANAYWVLCKPNVVLLMLLTVSIGMILAAQEPLNIGLLFATNMGVGFCAAAAATINQWVDRRIDTAMKRTQHRPLVKGKVTPQQALLFSAVLALIGQTILMFWVNALTAWLTFATLIGYAVIYTALLKRATPQNIVIGGLAGAMPPLLGWTAVTGEIGSGGLLLVLIIFVWTPPHFWALAIHRIDDYKKAKVPMLPVTHGIQYTKQQMVLYTILLFAVSLLPFITGLLNEIYLLSAIILNTIFLYWVFKLIYSPSTKTAIRTFVYSIIYLMMLFVAMLIDKAFL